MNPQAENHEVTFQRDLQALRKANAEAQCNIMLPKPAKDTIAALVRVIDGQQQQIDMLLAAIVGEKPDAPRDEAGMPLLAIAADDNPATGRA